MKKMSNAFVTSAKKLYTCDVCNGQFAWSSRSRVFGSIGHADCGAREFIVCSQHCLKNAPTESQLEHIIGVYRSRRGGYVTGSHWEDWDKHKEEKL